MAIMVTALIVLGLLIDYSACWVGGEADRQSEEWHEKHFNEWSEKYGESTSSER